MQGKPDLAEPIQSQSNLPNPSKIPRTPTKSPGSSPYRTSGKLTAVPVPLIATEAEAQRLEGSLLADVPYNFMFNKGQELTGGLIDPERLHQVLSKVRTLAGADKKIDYAEVADYSSQLPASKEVGDSVSDE